MIRAYPTVYNLGHAAVVDLLSDCVVVEEKIDGSQISFGRFGGDLEVKSRGRALVIDAPENMFAAAVESIKERTSVLEEGWTYRGEYLAKPKHNVLQYDRIPKDNIILFDVDPAEELYLSPEAKRVEADRIGLECVPLLFDGMVNELNFLHGLLDRESCLGGTKIEGVVVKNYFYYGSDKKALMGKLVAEQFRESHAREWGAGGSNHGDILTRLRARYCVERRWEKAVERMRDAGLLKDTPADIGGLIPEVKADIVKECEGEIRDELWAWAAPKILGSAVAGLAKWYKELLAKKQFEGTKHDPDKLWGGAAPEILSAAKAEFVQWHKDRLAKEQLGGAKHDPA